MKKLLTESKIIRIFNKNKVMTQEQLNTLSELLAAFKSEYTDIDNDGYWNVEEVEGLVDSAISDNNTN